MDARTDLSVQYSLELHVAHPSHVKILAGIDSAQCVPE
jgi:hypothetical protein